MRVTIEGDLEQISDAAAALTSVPKTDRQIKLQRKKAEREAYAEKRALIRRAFEVVRYDDSEKDRSEVLLAALTKVGGMTDAALKMAQHVLERRAIAAHKGE